MAYHNMCSGTLPPPGITSLLGLGLKFCIESPRPSQSIDDSIQRFHGSIRLHFHFKDEEENNEKIVTASNAADEYLQEESYIPSLYVPSTWNPPPSKFD
jgi:hypothetical protein